MPRLVPHDLGFPLIPDDDRTGAAPVTLVHALEVTRGQHVVIHRHSETADPGVERRAFRHGPRTQHVAGLKAEIEMQRGRVMELHDEAGRCHAPIVPAAPS